MILLSSTAGTERFSRWKVVNLTTWWNGDPVYRASFSSRTEDRNFASAFRTPPSVRIENSMERVIREKEEKKLAGGQECLRCVVDILEGNDSFPRKLAGKRGEWSMNTAGQTLKPQFQTNQTACNYFRATFPPRSIVFPVWQMENYFKR